MRNVSDYLLALDFGHGGGRATLYNLDNHKIFSSYQKWSYFSPEDDELRKEFIPSNFFEILCTLVRVLLKENRINPNEVVGISTASMRHTCVFIGKNGKELYGGPNIDTRGLFYQDVIEEELDFDVFNITGQWPPLMFMPARLLWFKEEQPEVFKNISYALTGGDWLIYKLTNEFSSEPSLASATMLLDLVKRKWLTYIMDSLGLGDIALPKLYNSGDRIGQLIDAVAKKMKLKSGIPVSIGGADTQLGLLACSAVSNGDVGLVAGTSTPVMMVTSRPVVDKNRQIWTHCHVHPERWVIESNAQMGGLSYEWLCNSFQQLLGKNKEETYKFMEKLASNIPPGSDDMIASLGSEILKIDDLSIMRPAIYSFNQPGHPMTTNPVNFGHFIRATLENISFAVKGNIKQVESIIGIQKKKLLVTGGMSKNNLWLDILSNITGKKIIATNIAEGTSIGSIMCAAIGAEIYKDFNEARKNIVMYREEIIPSNDKVQVYKNCYNNWKQWYDRLGEI